MKTQYEIRARFENYLSNLQTARNGKQKGAEEFIRNVLHELNWVLENAR